MLRNTMSSTCFSSSAHNCAEAGFAYPSCAVKSLSFSGISLLVSVFAIIMGLCGKTVTAGSGLLYIINVPVLIVIINAVIIYLAVFKAQGQKAMNLY